jgi:hypothetical protein
MSSEEAETLIFESITNGNQVKLKKRKSKKRKSKKRNSKKRKSNKRKSKKHKITKKYGKKYTKKRTKRNYHKKIHFGGMPPFIDSSTTPILHDLFAIAEFKKSFRKRSWCQDRNPCDNLCILNDTKCQKNDKLIEELNDTELELTNSSVFLQNDFYLGMLANKELKKLVGRDFKISINNLGDFIDAVVNYDLDVSKQPFDLMREEIKLKSRVMRFENKNFREAIDVIEEYLRRKKQDFIEKVDEDDEDDEDVLKIDVERESTKGIAGAPSHTALGPSASTPSQLKDLPPPYTLHPNQSGILATVAGQEAAAQPAAAAAGVVTTVNRPPPRTREVLDSLKAVRAIWDFTAMTSLQLSVSAGEILRLVGKSPLDPNWWVLLRNDGSDSGFVPANHVELLVDDSSPIPVADVTPAPQPTLSPPHYTPQQSTLSPPHYTPQQSTLSPPHYTPQQPTPVADVTPAPQPTPEPGTYLDPDYDSDSDELARFSTAQELDELEAHPETQPEPKPAPQPAPQSPQPVSKPTSPTNVPQTSLNFPKFEDLAKASRIRKRRTLPRKHAPVERVTPKPTPKPAPQPAPQSQPVSKPTSPTNVPQTSLDSPTFEDLANASSIRGRQRPPSKPAPPPKELSKEFIQSMINRFTNPKTGKNINEIHVKIAHREALKNDMNFNCHNVSRCLTALGFKDNSSI